MSVCSLYTAMESEEPQSRAVSRPNHKANDEGDQWNKGQCGYHDQSGPPHSPDSVHPQNTHVH